MQRGAESGHRGRRGQLDSGQRTARHQRMRRQLAFEGSEVGLLRSDFRLSTRLPPRRLPPTPTPASARPLTATPSCVRSVKQSAQCSLSASLRTLTFSHRVRPSSFDRFETWLCRPKQQPASSSPHRGGSFTAMADLNTSAASSSSAPSSVPAPLSAARGDASNSADAFTDTKPGPPDDAQDLDCNIWCEHC